jgi:hypothetical protein
VLRRFFNNNPDWQRHWLYSCYARLPSDVELNVQIVRFVDDHQPRWVRKGVLEVEPERLRLRIGQKDGPDLSEGNLEKF